MLPDAPGCWLWTGATSNNGYGNISTETKGQSVLAHRLSYQMHRGDIPESQLVRHRCDNRCCVNPSHLEIGSYADNSADMVKRGRATKGNPMGSRRKLSEPDVIAIRVAGSTPERHRDIATRFGISKAQVSKIISMKSWIWLNESKVVM